MFHRSSQFVVQKLQNYSYNETTKECKYTKEILQIFLAFGNLLVAKLSVYFILFLFLAKL